MSDHTIADLRSERALRSGFADTFGADLQLFALVICQEEVE
jgi:hypothetical protein